MSAEEEGVGVEVAEWGVGLAGDDSHGLRREESSSPSLTED